MSDYIPQDVLVLILKRLPVKTLLRCCCVSKSWKQLISSNSFILHHLSVQNRRIIAQDGRLRHLVFDPQTLPLFERLSAPFKVKREHRSRYGFTFSSLHGVNCIYNGAQLLLYNPSIRQQLTIPLPQLSFFSAADDYYDSGFWIDPSNNDFKVVIFRLEMGDAVLFSSKERSWMEFDIGDIGDCYPASSPQVMLQEFRTIELPPHSSTWVNICKWEDSLSVVCYDCLIVVWECESWVMRNGAWTKMFNILLPQGINHVYCALGSRGRVLVSNDKYRLVVHDPEDGFIRLKTRFVESDSGLFSFSYDFVESLVFPDRNCISDH